MDSLDLSSVGEALTSELGGIIGAIVLLVVGWLPVGSVQYFPPVEPI